MEVHPQAGVEGESACWQDLFVGGEVFYLFLPHRIVCVFLELDLAVPSDAEQVPLTSALGYQWALCGASAVSAEPQSSPRCPRLCLV